MNWMRYRAVWLLVGLLAASALLAGCGASAGADTLTGTKWELEELNGRDALDDVLATMELGEDDDLSGNASCNRYIGSWETDEDRQITLSPGGTTMMACPEAIMTQETAFLAALAAATRYELDENDLELYNAEGREVAEFERMKQSRLTRTTWQAMAINNGQQAVVSVLDGTTVTANFGADDTVSGNGGCNTFNAGFSTDGNEISIDQAASTLMACDQPVMDQETAFMQALANAVTYELGDESLILRDADESMLVWFREAD